MRWFGHVQRRDVLYVKRRMLRTKQPNRRRERPRRSFMDAVRKDMQVVGVTAVDAKGRLR